MKFSRITGGEQRKDGIHVKWKVISIANCEFENEKKRRWQHLHTVCKKFQKSLIFIESRNFFMNLENEAFAR